MSCKLKAIENLQEAETHNEQNKNIYVDVIAQCDVAQLWWEEYYHFHHDVMMPYTWNLAQLKPEYAEISQHLRVVLELHMEIISIAACQNGKPDDIDYLFNALLESISVVKECRISYSSSSGFNLLKTIKVGVGFFGWVIRKWNPAKYIKEIEITANHYTNLIPLTPEIHTFLNMSKSWIGIIKMCREYVCDHHKSGLTWKSKRIKENTDLKSSSQCSLRRTNSNQLPDFSEVFQQIRNCIPHLHLKKVDDDMKSYVNQFLRKTGLVQMEPKSNLYTSVNDDTVFELYNRKWIIENQNENQHLIIDETDEKQIVYMYNCRNSILKVLGKVNSIIIDSCQNCDFVFNEAWSICNFVNCTNIKVQVDGLVPLISLEITDGIHIYIKETYLMETEILSTKTCHAVVSLLREDGDITEFPIKEQFKSVWDGYTLHTDPM